MVPTELTEVVKLFPKLYPTLAEEDKPSILEAFSSMLYSAISSSAIDIDEAVKMAKEVDDETQSYILFTIAIAHYEVFTNSSKSLEVLDQIRSKIFLAHYLPAFIDSVIVKDPELALQLTDKLSDVSKKDDCLFHISGEFFYLNKIDKAIETVLKIADVSESSRLLLGCVDGMCNAGNLDEARKIAKLIPDPEKQKEAFDIIIKLENIDDD